MPIAPTYPGVYIQEVPSGVRTISGVSTAVAMFVGRTARGPVCAPKLCLNFGEFDKTFGSDDAGSDIARSVRLFFDNGGMQCYVTRIASGATPAQVTLLATDKTPVLKVTARSPGLEGEMIRLSVTYSGTRPESTFNLEVFRWASGTGGALTKADAELYQALSMDPLSPRYAVDVVNQSSVLVTLEDLSAAAATAAYSQSGRPVASKSAAIMRTSWKALLGKAATTNQFRLSVAGSAPVAVDLSSIDVEAVPVGSSNAFKGGLATAIQNVIGNALVGGPSVTVTLEDGPAGATGTDFEKTTLLCIASTAGDVVVQPGDTADLATPLQLGTGQGGLEVSKYGETRPAPNGLVFDLDDLNGFASLKQSAFNALTLGSADMTVAFAPVDPTITEPHMFQGDGVRDKLATLATAVNDKRTADPSFKWQAELWGSRLALLPQTGSENLVGTLSTHGADGVDIDDATHDYFVGNTRFYSLGSTGQGDYQTPGVKPSAGTAPQLQDYRDAFNVIDQRVDLFNLLVLPSDRDHTSATRKSLWGPASDFCVKRRAFLLMDAPDDWRTYTDAVDLAKGVVSLRTGLAKDHAALYFPRVVVKENGRDVKVGPAGAIAGLMARVDSARGIWKAPAGTEADIRGIVGLDIRLTDEQNGMLNPHGVNCLRALPNGIVAWGARTMDGDDDFGSEWKYVPIRRLALYLEESLYRGTKWAVFEPNDEPLWGQLRLNIGAFMHTLYRQGAFQGKSPKEAYLVKCDAETTTQDDRNRGIVNILVGFAPLKPAEFVILQIQQLAGQIQA